MNPVMRMLQSNGSQSQISNVGQLLKDIQSGAIDPKQKSIEMLQSLPQANKQAILQMLPNLKKLGKVMGASDNTINNFVAELQKNLR